MPRRENKLLPTIWKNVASREQQLPYNQTDVASQEQQLTPKSRPWVFVDESSVHFQVLETALPKIVYTSNLLSVQFQK